MKSWWIEDKNQLIILLFWEKGNNSFFIGYNDDKVKKTEILTAISVLAPLRILIYELCNVVYNILYCNKW